ncbi:MAG: hypothetical protein ACREI2_06090 [Nitrospiraceae bacterium]
MWLDDAKSDLAGEPRWCACRARPDDISTHLSGLDGTDARRAQRHSGYCLPGSREGAGVPFRLVR